jgi:hypothetical protein
MLKRFLNILALRVLALDIHPPTSNTASRTRKFQSVRHSNTSKLRIGIVLIKVLLMRSKKNSKQLKKPEKNVQTKFWGLNEENLIKVRTWLI